MTSGATTVSSVLGWVAVAAGWLFFLLFIVGLVRRVKKDYFGKAVTVKAQVTDKQAETYHPVSRFGPGTATNYYLAFATDGKSLRFKVSYWVYNAVNKGKKVCCAIRATALSGSSKPFSVYRAFCGL